MATHTRCFAPTKALEEGRVKQMPFPFQPDWVLEAMGMGKYGPADKYEMVSEPGRFKLIERTKSPQGVPVKKIIVFNALNRQTQPETAAGHGVLARGREDRQSDLLGENHSAVRSPGGHGEIPRELELAGRSKI